MLRKVMMLAVVTALTLASSLVPVPTSASETRSQQVEMQADDG